MAGIDSKSRPVSLFCQIEIALIAVLYVYANWYVQTFANISLVVKGSTVLILVFMLLDVFFESNGDFNLELIPKGMIVAICLSPYFLVVGFFVAYNFSVLLDSLIIYTGYAVTGIAICYVSSKKQSIDWFMKIVIFTALLSGIYALVAGENYYGGIRLSAHNNIHIFSLILVLGVFALAYRSKKTITSLLIHGIPTLFLYYCIIESSSRKCFIAASVIIVLWIGNVLHDAIKDTENSFSRILIIAVVAVILFLVYSRFSAFFATSRTFARFQTFTDEDSNSSRIAMYIKAFDIFMEKPLFGGGFDQYQFWSGGGGYSHATYAEAIADFGLLGSVIYFAPIVAVAWNLYKLSFFTSKSYHSRIAFTLLVVELFLGIGQIFFIEPQHMFAFFMIYWIEMNESRQFEIGKRGSYLYDY